MVTTRTLEWSGLPKHGTGKQSQRTFASAGVPRQSSHRSIPFCAGSAFIRHRPESYTEMSVTYTKMRASVNCCDMNSTSTLTPDSLPLMSLRKFCRDCGIHNSTALALETIGLARNREYLWQTVFDGGGPNELPGQGQIW